MDQSLLAGVGNVQAMEALWRAKIHPETPAAALTSSQYQALDQALQEQLAWTLNLLEQEEEIHYVEEAGAINPFLIYQRTGSPCPRCSTPLARSVQAGRGSWWCPRCQPSPTASC
jgi:formamidopyrimidine-DNA glycosylase